MPGMTPIRWSPGCNCCGGALVCCGTGLLDSPHDFNAPAWTLFDANTIWDPNLPAAPKRLETTAAGVQSIGARQTYDFSAIPSGGRINVCAVVAHQIGLGTQMNWARLAITTVSLGTIEVWFNIQDQQTTYVDPSQVGLVLCPTIEPLQEQYVPGVDDWSRISFQVAMSGEFATEDVELTWNLANTDGPYDVAAGTGNYLYEMTASDDCTPCSERRIVVCDATGVVNVAQVRCYLQSVEYGPRSGTGSYYGPGCNYSGPEIDLGLPDFSLNGFDEFWYWYAPGDPTCALIDDDPPTNIPRTWRWIQLYCGNHEVGYSDIASEPGADPRDQSAFETPLIFDPDLNEYWIPDNTTLTLELQGTGFNESGQVRLRFADESAP